MRVELVTIGDEILIGQTVNTNAAWIGEQLSLLGINLQRILTISDTREAILDALEDCRKRAELVILTGGLGPTKDDLTKPTLCEYFDTKLIMNTEVLAKIEAYFKLVNRPMLEVNVNQALLPESCEVLPNEYGTASGMWFEKGAAIFVSLPGVPYEMKALMENEVLPRILNKYSFQSAYYRSVLTQGIGESFLADIIQEWEISIRNIGLGLAYLPSPGIVKLRISGNEADAADSKRKVEKAIADLEKLIPQYIYGYDKDKLEEVVGKLLKNKGLTVSTAESCTGGYIAHLITSVSGSSSYFKGSIVAYANELKQQQLGVNPIDLEQHGAVSREVVEQMAAGVRSLLKTDYAIATSGIAGPDGGTHEKPVGTIWISVSGPGGVYSKMFSMGANRERNIRKSALMGLFLLRKKIIDDSCIVLPKIRTAK
ncbi:MAG: competence/damage-inducible protein A [Flavobacteriales bacterium]